MVDPVLLQKLKGFYTPEIAEKNKGAILSYAYAIKRGNHSYERDNENIDANDKRFGPCSAGN